MTARSTYRLLWLALLSAFWQGCGQSGPTGGMDADSAVVNNSPEVAVPATQFTVSMGDVLRDTTAQGVPFVRTGGGEHWLAFDVEVPAAGRYRVEVFASANEEGATAWIEDYYDNPDQRTYNITGTMQLSAAGQDEENFSVSTKMGSPLNEGLHRMKLHVKGSADVLKIVFTLIRKHQASPVFLTQEMGGEEWTIVWSDEFEGSGIPDTSKWTFDIGDWGWGNNELQYYTEARTENARLENGNLIIEARKNDMGAAWTSARLTTRGKVAFTYGRIEFRAMVPAQKGNWAAGWTLGDSYIDELSWPYCGEIDILESVGYQMDNETGDGTAHASAHCGAYYFKLGNQPTGTTPVKNMNREFHIYAIEWTPESIVASVDGVEYFTYNDNSNGLTWPFDKPQNIILNLTMGGGWGGLEGMDESVTSQQMVVDYVRVYEKRK